MRYAIVAVLIFGCAMRAQASLHTEEVEYTQDNTILRGYLAYDDATDEKRPGVLVVHEWWGLNEYAEERAEALALEGYVALALDMYGEGKSTTHPEEAGEWSGFIRQNREIGRQRFLAAYDLLRKHPLCIDDRIAAIGYCFGGNVVLSMALECLDLRGVVSFHGSLPAERAEPNTVKAKILVCHGAVDPLVPREQIDAFQKNLQEAGADWQFIFYGGAKHSFTNPKADSHGMPALGYNRAADERSWRAMLDLFDEIFAD